MDSNPRIANLKLWVNSNQETNRKINLSRISFRGPSTPCAFSTTSSSEAMTLNLPWWFLVMLCSMLLRLKDFLAPSEPARQVHLRARAKMIWFDKRTRFDKVPSDQNRRRWWWPLTVVRNLHSVTFFHFPELISIFLVAALRWARRHGIELASALKLPYRDHLVGSLHPLQWLLSHFRYSTHPKAS